MSVNHNWMPQPCITSLYTIFLFFSSLYTFSPKRNNQHVAVLCSKRLPCDSGKKKKNRIAFIDFQFYGDRRYDLAIGGRRKGGGEKQIQEIRYYRERYLASLLLFIYTRRTANRRDSCKTTTKKKEEDEKAWGAQIVKTGYRSMLRQLKKKKKHRPRLNARKTAHAHTNMFFFFF